jgi:hypothetical protein
MVYLIASPPERADQNVMRHIGPQIPDMGKVINRRPAAIKTNLALLQRLELLHSPPKGVEEGKGHDVTLREKEKKSKGRKMNNEQ